jgi:hypothetical protein
VRGRIDTFIRRIAPENETLKEYIHNHVQKAVIEMQISVPGSTDQRMNLAILNGDGTQEYSAQWVTLRDKHAGQKLPQISALSDQLIYPLIFWNGEGGLEMTKEERSQATTISIRKLFIC